MKKSLSTTQKYKVDMCKQVKEFKILFMISRGFTDMKASVKLKYINNNKQILKKLFAFLKNSK